MLSLQIFSRKNTTPAKIENIGIVATVIALSVGDPVSFIP